MSAETDRVAANLEQIRARIARAAERAGRRAEDVTLVAVSKTFPASSIRAAYDAGLRHFGENRVQEWESKQPRVANLGATWHLIGHLQSNKAARAVRMFHRVDSVDSLPLSRKLDAAAAEDPAREGKPLPILIEVHMGDEATKSGVSEADLPALAEGILTLPHLELSGLMTIPPFFEEIGCVRPFFRKLRELRDQLSRRIGRPFPVLSMGMSHDFEIAIEECATEIRIGTAIFGTRQLRT